MTTAIERAFARANLYRFLSLAFAYPTTDIYDELRSGLEAARVAAETISPAVAARTQEAANSIEQRERRALAADYRHTFTLSASPDCPLNESAYSAKHVYQEMQELADIAGFYTAFGLEIAGERPDELAAELEFCGVLALKEGLARENAQRANVAVCRDAERRFVHDHLGRWGENIGRRIEMLAEGTPYAEFARLLATFVHEEIDTLEAGPVVPYQEVPRPPEPPDDGSCPAEEGLGTVAYDLQDGAIPLEVVEAAPTHAGGS